ncbi:ice-binding family protein [Streptomyces sp. H39-S7]|uniref:ice-binding family protein n=1 Tax=Streptomyces sp. H39-S7 TaxID=3004357 RepID=UPI0022AFFC4E|nr:ice-binding family protein [Streptomyces sp. H39-S7]MCZ4124210.1 ice-binding family protein [Streptomyces sp. H39-S7]
MTLNAPVVPNARTLSAWIAAVVATVMAALMVAMASSPALATATPVPLATADSFAVLAGESVTNTGPSVITGDLGVSPGTSITGFPPGQVNGAQHSADGVALQTKSDLVAAYNNAAGQATDEALPPDAGGLTLVPGVYTASSTLHLTGTLTLDAEGDPNAVWVFQVGSGLTTASASRVLLINGAAPCNVFWQVGSSATLGTDSTFVGTILALTSINATTGASIDGRALARNGSVTLDTNRITRATCAAGSTGGLVSGGLVAGTTTGGTATGGTTTTGGLIAGVTTGGTNGGLLGGVLTGGVIGGTPGGLIAGVTTGGTTVGTTGSSTAGTTSGYPGGDNGGNHGGASGYPGGDHGGETGGYPGGDHGGETGGYPGGDHGGASGGDHGGETGGYGYGAQPPAHEGQDSPHDSHGAYEAKQ